MEKGPESMLADLLQLSDTLLDWTGIKKQFQRATYGSPLRDWRLHTLIGVALPIGAILYLLTSRRIHQGAPYGVYLAALILLISSCVRPGACSACLTTASRNRSGCSWWPSGTAWPSA
jgi:hypothetical protein